MHTKLTLAIKYGSYAVFALMLSGCESLFFWPSAALVDSPKRFGFEREIVLFDSADNTRLHGWYLSSTLPDQQSLGTVYFLHGNAANLSYHIANIHWLTQYGWNVFIIDYRGYGRSQGEPDFKSVIEDATAGYHWLVDKGDKNIIVLGQSLGGAIAVGMLGLNKDIRASGLILDSTFDSHRQIFRDTLGKSWLFWLFQVPLSWGISDEFAPKHYIAKIPDTPTLFVHSDADKLIDKKHASSLYLLSKSKKRLWITSGHGHAVIWHSKEWRNRLVCQLEKWPALVSADAACESSPSESEPCSTSCSITNLNSG